MGKKIWQIVFLCLIFTQMLWAEKGYRSKRWRLKFENTDPEAITLTYPNGEKKTYWYIKYKIINNTERDIPWMIHIRMVIDKAKEGIQESKLPGLFYEAKLPEKNKEKYLNNLQTYYDTDFPYVRKEILKQLRLYPSLSPTDKAILNVLSTTIPKNILDISKECNLPYSQIEQRINDLVIQNLAISQEVSGRGIFMGTKKNYAIFLVHNQEIPTKIGELFYGWELLSFDSGRVVLKKEGIIRILPKGSAIEYLYSKTDKIFMERDAPIVSGMSAKGIYKGIVETENKADRRYKFQNTIIAKKSVVHGLAIFNDVSHEMDFMGIVVSGLVDPILKKNRKAYLENVVFLAAYKKPSDSFGNTISAIKPLYKREVILSTKEIKKK